MSWTSITLIVPLELLASKPGTPSTLDGYIAPGGGLVVVKSDATTALVDILTTDTNIAALRKLGEKLAAFRRIGSWKSDGEPKGASYTALDAEGKRTKDSKLVAADAPFDKASYVARIGGSQDVHGWAGWAPRVKAEVGKKPEIDQVDAPPIEGARPKVGTVAQDGI